MSDAATSRRWVHHPANRRFRFGAWGLTVAGLLLLGVAAALLLPVARVGDGMEYYGLFYAWSQTLRPWMNETSFVLYQQLHESGSIVGTLDRSYLEAAFPALRLGETADFNHFWFYSLLAALVNAPFALVGLSLGAHGSFLALHALLFVGLLAIATICHGWRGFWTVVMVTFGSPIVWYFNKVHTEFLTYCMTLAGIILAMRNQLVASAVLMAAAATHNPGLSFVPVVLVAIRGLLEQKVAYSRWEVIGAVAIVLLLALHPVYYFLRYEVVTPQLLAGGAAPGAGLSYAYIWLVDPDVGLFPNWPLGLALLIAGVFLWRFVTRDVCLRPVSPLHLWVAIAVFFVASIYSHASTENLNSGATPGLSRYALWYIPLIYPAALAVTAAILHLTGFRRVALGSIVWTGVLAGLILTLSTRWESYTSPSFSSRLVQTYTPWLYTPPAEIFAERYSGLGEAILPLAVVGPDCRKTLLLPWRANEDVITVSDHCPFNGDQIRPWVSSARDGASGPIFVELDPNDPAVVMPLAPVAIGQVVGHDTVDSNIALSGWSGAEPSHRWSNRPESSIGFTLPEPALPNLCMIVDGFTYGRQTITASIDGNLLIEQTLHGDARLVVPTGERTGATKIDLSYSDPTTPPNDPRLIAFGLRSFVIDVCP